MIVPVLHASCSHLVFAGTFHDMQLPPPPPIKLPPVVHFEIATMGWPLGSFTHKKQDNVLVDGAPAVQNGHDVGQLITHVGIPNALLAVHAGFSKHKVMFPISHLMIGEKTAGTYLGFIGGLACANPVSMPTGCVILLKWTVLSTMTPWDILKGLYSIGIEVLFDACWNKIFKGAWYNTHTHNAPKNALEKRLRMPRVDAPVPLLKLPKATSYAEMLFGKFDPNNAGASFMAARVAARFVKGHEVEVLMRSLPAMFLTKTAEHVPKSWVASPAVVGGLAKGEPGIGRGHLSASVKFF